MDKATIKRLMPVLIVLLLVSLLGLAWSFYALQQASGKLKTAQDSQVASYKLASELRQSSDDLTRMVRTYTSTTDEKYKDVYNQILDIRNGKAPRPENYHRVYWDFILAGNKAPGNMTEAIPFTTLLEQAGFTQEELAKLTEAENRSNQLAELEGQAMQLIQDAKNAKATYDSEGNLISSAGSRATKVAQASRMVNDDNYHTIKSGVMQPLDEFFALMETRTGQEVATASSDMQRNQYIFFGVLLLSMLLLSAFFLLSRKQTQIDLEERAQAAAEAEAENDQLNNSVISILEAVNQLSQKDLTAKAPVTEDVIGTVSASINLLTDETSSVLNQVRGIADQVASVSGNVKAQAENVSLTAEQERESVDNMVNALFDATQTMNQMAALADQSNEAAGQATQVTNQALESVNQSVGGMEGIRVAIAETEKRIKRLGERSQEITGIVNLINTISERTHVLSLNASMQAALAGDAGRGFAVVAEEVQKLAESSKNATEQIAALVNNIQIETGETINTMNRTIEQVVEGSEHTQKAGEQMRLTQEITERLVSQVRNIANASQKQKSMSADLLEAVQKIGESTELTARQIEAQNAETESLQQAASQLVESVGVFKLPQQITG